MTRADRAALLALNGYLLSPILIQMLLGPAMGWRDPLLIFNFLTSVLWLALAHFICSRPFLTHLVLTPFYVTTAIDLFLLGQFGNRLSSGYVTIALTSYLDTPELLSTYALGVSLTGFVLIGIYAYGLYAIRNVHMRRHQRLAGLAAGSLLLIYGAVAVRGTILSGFTPAQAVLDVVAHETSAPAGVVFQAGLAVKQHIQSEEIRSHRGAFSFAAHKAPSAETEIYVLVIGESSRPQNWSLFGYARDTTPRIRAAGVIALPHLLTTAPHTAIAVPSMLSLRPITAWAEILAQKSIVGAFRETGFKTYWLSAQPDDNWAGIIPQIAAEAQRRRYYDNQLDGALLEQFGRIVDDAPIGSKSLVVLHTKGSHFDYRRRYPRDFQRFATTGGSRRDDLVGAYDNSVLYTDWLLGEMIDKLKRSNSVAALFYASDHGENLLDDDRHLLGHALGNAFDLRAASFVWLSDGLRASEDDKVRNADRNAAARLSLSNVPHSLLDLAAIEAKGLDRTQSIFSETFERRPRSYIVRGELIHEGTSIVDQP